MAAASALLSDLGGSSVVKVFLDYRLGIVLNGTAVAQWLDQSGNGNHATQATAASQPEYSATDGVDFDGSADHMLFPAGSILAANAAQHVLTKYKLDSAPGAGTAQTLYSIPSGAAPAFNELDFVNVATYPTKAVLANCVSPGYVLRGCSPVLGTTEQTDCYSYNGSGNTTSGNYAYRSNGSGVAITAPGGTGARLATNRSALGCAALAASEDQRLNGKIKVLIICNAVLSAGQVTLAETYMAGA